MQLAIQTEGRDDRQIDGFAIEHRESPGKTEADRAHLAVGLGTEGRPIGAEELFGRAELHMYFQADHQLPAHPPARLNRHPASLILISTLQGGF